MRGTSVYSHTKTTTTKTNQPTNQHTNKQTDLQLLEHKFMNAFCDKRPQRPHTVTTVFPVMAGKQNTL